MWISTMMLSSSDFTIISINKGWLNQSIPLGLQVFRLKLNKCLSLHERLSNTGLRPRAKERAKSIVKFAESNLNTSLCETSVKGNQMYQASKHLQSTVSALGSVEKWGWNLIFLIYLHLLPPLALSKRQLKKHCATYEPEPSPPCLEVHKKNTQTSL